MLQSSVPVLVLFGQMTLFPVGCMWGMSSGDCWNRFSASLELHSTALLYSFIFPVILV